MQFFLSRGDERISILGSKDGAVARVLDYHSMWSNPATTPGRNRARPAPNLISRVSRLTAPASYVTDPENEVGLY